MAGRYKIIKSLGEGGFGEAYLAEDQHLPDAQCCVVKKLKTDHHDAATLQVARRLFDSEAKMLHKLGHHEQIPRLLAHFEENDGFYLVEEFVAGHSLDQEMVLGQPVAEADVLLLLRDILCGLAFVHQNQVIHRDIKPSNLIRRQEDNQVVLIDFGAVKQMTTQLINNHSRTPQTVLIGSPGYVPSEQFRGNPKLSSDVYAVGMIGIQALTGINPAMGQFPEDEETGELVWRNHAQVSPELATILDKMVLYDYRQRYKSAMSALAAIQELIEEREAATNPPAIDDIAWAETNIGAEDVPATVVNPESQDHRQVAAKLPSLETTQPEAETAIHDAAIIQDTESQQSTRYQAAAPSAAPIEEAAIQQETESQSSTRYQATVSPAPPPESVPPPTSVASVPLEKTEATVAATPAVSTPVASKAQGSKKLKAAVLGIGVLLFGGGAVGLASPHVEPLCQVFNNCSRAIRFQTVYEDAAADAKAADEAATAAKDIKALQIAHDQMEEAIANLKSVPPDVKAFAIAQKELPEYEKQFKAMETRLVAEKKAEEQFQKAEDTAKTAKEKMAAVEKSESVATLEDAKKQWQASQAHLKSIPEGSFMTTQAKAMQESHDKTIKTLQDKINQRIAAEKKRQQVAAAAAAAARRKQQAAAAAAAARRKQQAAARSTPSRASTSSRASTTRSTSSTRRRSTSSTQRRSTPSAPKAAPKKPLWGPPAGKEPLW